MVRRTHVTRGVLLMGCGFWVLLVPVAILNAGLRETLLVPMLGAQWARPLSGVTMSLLVIAFSLLVVPWLGATRRAQYWMVGTLWLVLTVAFEFLFGRFVLHASWEKLFAAYDLTSGDLWTLVLMVMALAPVLAARLRGLP